MQSTQQATARKARPCRTPDYGPWPPAGYVTAQQMMAALGGASDETIRNYERAGLLPPRMPINAAGRGGWPVDVARAALAELPGKLAARNEALRPRKAVALVKARAARSRGH